MRSIRIILILMVITSILTISCAGESLNQGGKLQIITSITISGFLAVGVDVAWSFTKHLGLKFGLSAGVDLYEELSPMLWTRALFIHKLNPANQLTFYGGEGIDTVIAFTEINVETLVFVGLAGGLEWAAFPTFHFIGEGRFGVPLLGERFTTIIVPLGVSVGGALTI